MKNTCMKWKDQLLEAALGEMPKRELRDHLAQCADCAAELGALQARRRQMDSLLPQLARGAEPSPELRRRILAGVETAKPRGNSNVILSWATAGVAVIVIAVVIGAVWHRSSVVQETELRGAQALAQWHAPTDVLLRTPGSEFLTETPRLGESYIKIPIETDQGGKK